MFEKDGLIQLNKDVPIINSSKKIYVIIHPFWNEFKIPYIDNLEKVLKNSESPILTVEYNFLLICKQEYNTISKYKNLNPEEDRFFLPTEYNYAKPNCGWEKTAEIINMFEPEEVIFGGATLMGNEKDGYHR